jgi:DNA-binding NarL/FixJ family response regulator
VTASTAAEQSDLAIRVVVDDHEIARAGLKAILASAPDFEVVGEAGPGDDLLQLVAQTQPDVVLLNPRLHAASGDDVCARLLEQHPELRILVVSTYAAIDLARACIAAGAHGYVLRQIDGLELMQAVRAVHHGQVAVSPAVAGEIIDEMRILVRVRTEPADWQSATARLAPTNDRPVSSASLSALSRLTSREREVLARLLDGERVRSIAADLFVSQSTVRNHLSSIFRKVGVHSQGELIRRLRSA